MRTLLIATLAAGAVLIAGCSTATNTTADPDTKVSDEAAFALTSRAFNNGQAIPVKYVNQGIPGGQNVSVPLAWTSAPAGTKGYALICIDRSSAVRDWVHWAVIDIPPQTKEFVEGSSPFKNTSGAKELKGTAGVAGWQGPAPAAGTGPHNYEFTLYALTAATITLPEQPTAAEFEAVVKPLTIASTKLVGTYEVKLTADKDL